MRIEHYVSPEFLEILIRISTFININIFMNIKLYVGHLILLVSCTIEYVKRISIVMSMISSDDIVV